MFDLEEFIINQNDVFISAGEPKPKFPYRLKRVCFTCEFSGEYGTCLSRVGSCRSGERWEPRVELNCSTCKYKEGIICHHPEGSCKTGYGHYEPDDSTIWLLEEDEEDVLPF